MENKGKWNKYVIWVFAVLVLLFCEYVFFRNVIGTELLFGDSGDGRLTNLLSEHWWRFFNGKEGFSEILMFYPDRDAFGYTDLFLGYGIFYSLFRLAGIDMFFAYKWTLMLIHFFGVVSMFFLLKETLKLKLPWALFGTMAFSFSPSYALRFNHTQLDAVSFLPVLTILLLGFVRNFNDRRKRNIYSYCFIALFVLITYTSWYVACFAGVFALVFAATWLIRLKLCGGVGTLGSIRTWIAKLGTDIAGYLIFCIVLYIPFMQIYIPVMLEKNGYSYTGRFLPEIIDLINVGESNLMLGSVIKAMRLSERDYSDEVIGGFSIILLLMFIITFIVHILRRSKNVFFEEAMTSVYISVIAILILIVRLSSNGISLWILLYFLMPVVRSMRALARFILWLSFPMAVISSYTADRYFSRKNMGNTAVAVCACVLLFISNIDRNGVSASWHRDAEMDFISSVSPPPEDAASFYITDTSDMTDAPFNYQMEAYEIAIKYSLKTINGYSGQTSAGWEGIYDVNSEDYEKSVSAWITEHGLENVYVYDRGNDTWKRHG